MSGLLRAQDHTRTSGDELRNQLIHYDLLYVEVQFLPDTHAHTWRRKHSEPRFKYMVGKGHH